MGKAIKRLVIVSLIFPLILLIIIITMLGEPEDNSSKASEFNASFLAEDVLKWNPLIQKYAEKYEIEEYTPLILAIMQQESGGRCIDVMQSSEGSFNTRYSNVPNGILDPEYSIECGVQEVKAALQGAGVKDLNDMENIKLALQSYNFGPGFLNYAKERGGYSEKIAKDFSQYMIQQSRSKGEYIYAYGDVEYVPHVLRYYVSIGTSDNKLLNKVVQIASNQRGKIYVWGAAGPNTFDCSGLVSYCYNQAGYKHQRTTAQGYYDMSDRVSNPEVGDLIFFKNSWERDAHHIGIYIGNNEMIHAPQTGDVVKVSNYLQRSDFIGYGRLRLN